MSMPPVWGNVRVGSDTPHSHTILAESPSALISILLAGAVSCKVFSGESAVKSVGSKPDTSACGARLKAIRSSRGVTQASLGAMIGVPQSLVTRWERSSRWNPTAETVLKIAAALNCTPNDLLLDSNPA